MGGPGRGPAASSTAAEPEPSFRQNAGWIAGAIVIAGVLAVGAAFWFMYHP
jgi:hypothetical protein